MAVYKNLRKNVASKLSSIENIETFLWDRWLRPPASEEMEIQQLKSKLKPTDDIILTIDIPDSEKIEAKISKVKSIKASSRMYRLKSKSHPVFFGMGSTKSYNVDIQFNYELKQFFTTVVGEDGRSIYFLMVNSQKEKIKKQLNPETKNIPVAVVNLDEGKLTENLTKYLAEIPANNLVDFSIKNIKTKDINKDIPVRKIIPLDYQINLPQVIDYLSKLIPQVYDIALLNTLDGLTLGGKAIQVKMDLLEETPEISARTISALKKTAVVAPSFESEIKSGVFKNIYAKELGWGASKIKKMDFTSLSVKNNIDFSIKYDYDVSQKPVPVGKSSKIDTEPVNKVLQPVISLSEEEQTEIFSNLYPYQQEGIEFLSKNQRACLIDELSLGKSVQAISAVKYLIKTREIKTALIISQDYYAGDRNFNSKLKILDGWEGQIQKFAGNLSAAVLNTDTAGVIKGLEQQQYQIFIIPYSVIVKDAHGEILKSAKYANIDCICIDDAEVFTGSYNRFEKIIKAAGAKYIWLLFNNADEEFQKKIAADFNFSAKLSRSREQIMSQIPSLTRQDFWCDLDKKQNTEYDQTLFYVKSQIDDVLSTGNPYRLQAKVFTLLHQLKQITNFYSEEVTSNKAKLLLQQLGSMLKFGSRAVVFSQYDKFGTQKLAELFKQKNIPFISYSPSMPLAEIEKSVKKFGKDKSVKVFLINTQADITNIRFDDINYIIHFDQWWIPTKQWQLEEKIAGHYAGKKSVHIISYLTRNTIDEKLQLKLSEKYLLNKNLIDALGAITFSKLFSENDWLDVFDFSAEKKYKEESLAEYIEKIKALSPDMVMEKLAQLFSNLGYKYIEKSEVEKKKQYIVKGLFEKDKENVEFVAYCFPVTKKPDLEIINRIMKDAADKLHSKRVFIITLNHEEPVRDYFASPNLTYINLEIVSKYFQMLRIV